MATYRLILHCYDWGVSSDTLVVSTDRPITKVPEKENLSVFEQKEDKATRRTVRDVKQTGERELTITLQVSPEEGNPFTLKGSLPTNVWAKPYQFQITINGENVEVEPTAVETPADVFSKSEVTIDGVHYNYAVYSPDHETDTLFVWLHGLCEGQYEGSDAYIPLLSHNGVVLATEPFQKAVNYAHILVVQCPTFWRDNTGEGDNTDPRNRSGKSCYTKSLEKLIDQEVAQTEASKVVLAGCSNGGFMCLNLALNRPERYTAAVPVCESMRDEALTDADIEKLKNIPMYFMYSEDDDTVVPATHEIPTIERLRKAGAKEIHVATTEHVMAKDQDDRPIQLAGHCAWVDFDRNYGNVWQWIGRKTAE